VIVAYVGHEGAPGRYVRERFAGQVGFVPPGGRVFGSLTVAENLAVGAYPHRRQKAAVAERLAQVHERFPQLRPDQIAASLSGGEQQLLVIARALMGAPSTLVLEDPTAGLGPPAIAVLAEALRGLEAVIADESLALARLVADRIVLIDAGRVVLDAPRQEALEDPRLGVGYIMGSSSTA
jgi:branched-chain amino acid transport system ATP-binding protein